MGGNERSGTGNGVSGIRGGLRYHTFGVARRTARPHGVAAHYKRFRLPVQHCSGHRFCRPSPHDEMDSPYYGRPARGVASEGSCHVRNDPLKTTTTHSVSDHLLFQVGTRISQEALPIRHLYFGQRSLIDFFVLSNDVVHKQKPSRSRHDWKSDCQDSDTAWRGGCSPTKLLHTASS